MSGVGFEPAASGVLSRNTNHNAVQKSITYDSDVEY